MKFRLSRSELVKLIGRVHNVVSAKPAVPVLANILVEALDDQIVISATDLTVSMRVFVDAAVEDEGAIALPARRFFQLVRELTASEIDIECGAAEIAHIHSGTAHFKLNGMHKSEYPDLPNMAESATFSIESQHLKELLIKTSFACARDDSRHVLNGLYLSLENETLTFIGTDGKRLAKIHTDLSESLGLTRKMIIPLKGIEEMVKTLDADETAKFSILHDRVAIEVGHCMLITKLISGEYPDVNRVIPSREQMKNIPLEREELMTLLRQISLFTSEEVNSVRFLFTDGELQLFASSGEIGEGKVNMPVNYTGERLEIAFNPHILLNILKHLSDDTFNFGLIDSYNPGLITDSSNALFVVMPMRLM
ncbi:MAG: DNA polymerase III subunit beta [Simkaniaceae bacterium]